MTRGLQIVLIVGGIVAVLIAFAHIAIGSSSIPGSVPTNATMDSEDRFYAAIFLGWGVALIWCARDLTARGMILRFLIAVFFLGGVARIVSAVSVGLPNLFFQAMTALELLLPPVIWIWLKRVESPGKS